ncbi:GntR family transcriptional regulator [Pelagibius litoralis]|uniref:GntR family transcriptional regulator n=1 Tax=Pelagibius litoralis TaxID=374515 RepID=A0A967C2J5_9PROT|nr:GntR family transcriptional regulator [Pelagibius litoralis]NIA67120.1 GntR family transcriptional regulator [Pelagibius litoralis]
MTEIAEILNDNAWALARERKGNVVYHAVKRAILLRAFKAGDALIEQQIAAAMGCSQGPVREALMRLEQDGLVARRGYQGTLVSDTSAPEAAKMAQIRIEIETTGIRMAIPAMTSRKLDEIGGLLEELEGAEDRLDSYAKSDLDRAFHLALFSASGMHALEPILTRCCLHMHRFTFGNEARAKGVAANDYQRGPSRDQHRAIFEAIAGGRSDEAADILRRHVEAVIAYWAPDLQTAMMDGP